MFKYFSMQEEEQNKWVYSYISQMSLQLSEVI